MDDIWLIGALSWCSSVNQNRDLLGLFAQWPKAAVVFDPPKAMFGCFQFRSTIVKTFEAIKLATG